MRAHHDEIGLVACRGSEDLVARVTLGNQFLDVGRPSWSGGHDAMHTFEAPHNKVLWAVHVHGEIGGWPDVEDEFPLVVTPPEPTRGVQANDAGDEGGHVADVRVTGASAGASESGSGGRIVVALERAAWRPGETLRGNALWDLPTPPERVEARLYWRTSGKGTRKHALGTGDSSPLMPPGRPVAGRAGVRVRSARS